jgi:hypothetical protein
MVIMVMMVMIIIIIVIVVVINIFVIDNTVLREITTMIRVVIMMFVTNYGVIVATQAKVL